MVDLNRRGSRDQLGGVQGGENVIRIYYLRKTTIFSITGKKKSLLINDWSD